MNKLTSHIILKMTRSALALTLLLFAASTQSFAMISVGDISPREAKALGVSLRAERNGEAGVRVWLEFKAAGELAKSTSIQLKIGDGAERMMSAPLQVSSPTSGSMAVNFSAYPAYLSKSALMIVVYNGPKGDVGYRFKVTDFIEMEKIR